MNDFKKEIEEFDSFVKKNTILETDDIRSILILKTHGVLEITWIDKKGNPHQKKVHVEVKV